MASILVVDDESPIRESIRMFMTEKGHQVLTAPTIEACLDLFRSEDVQVVILDIRFPGGSGLDTLVEMQAMNPLPKVIMITAFQDMETTIEAMKRRAYDISTSPWMRTSWNGP